MFEELKPTLGSLVTYLINLFTTSGKLKSLEGLSGLEKSEAILHNLIIKEKVPGLSITINKNGETIFQNGFGYADIENKISVEPRNTIFRIASISKCITALAFGKMIEEGLLQFDDSFYKHVPYYPKKAYDFTLRQLASHTAGIRAYRGKEFGLNEPYSIADSLEVFKNDSLVFEPGKGYLYNSFDFVLLSLAMQEANGVPFETYVKEKILIPLGMTNTFAPPLTKSVSSIELANQAKFYTKTVLGFEKAIEVNNFYKLSGGGYLSTSDDVAKLGKAILEQKILDKGMFKELCSPQYINGKSTYYGLGFQVSKDKHDRSFIGHVGSSVGAYSNLFIYPKEELVISILINCTDSKIQDSLDNAIDALINLE
ncbi:serine hydrolase domain-containing protein [uncultured Croceitalea sp.]|uniref:serine hydrolase domain-containing protein n=1 Tax=uncultured Croceitalea sp. TaxID=1798908 RepID=UPI00374E3A42